MGFDIPDDIQDFSADADFAIERVERNSFDDDFGFRQEDGTNDPSARKLWLSEAYLYVDFDKDGIAEFRKVTKIGHSLLDNVEFDSLPIIGGTAVLMPHKHYGLSIFDLIGDIQLIKSEVTRQLLNNAYVANNGRMVVLDGMVNMSDLLTSRPNGIVRAKAMNAVQRLDQPVLGAPFYGLLEYFDKVAQTRVGATGFPNAVDPDAINAKAAFVDRFAEAAMERIHLMARILAEGPVKQIFWKILELEAKHRDKPKMARLRGKWVEVDPRDWKNKFDMTVTVGIGTGSQQTVLNGAMGILQIQEKMAMGGLAGQVVTPTNIFQAGRRYAKAVFPKDADVFFTDPQTVPPPQPKPDPEMEKINLAREKAGMQQQHKQQQLNAQMMTEEMNRQFKAWETQFKEMSKQNSEAVKETLASEREKTAILLQGMVDQVLQREKPQPQKTE
jgi:hypothetical protein